MQELDYAEMLEIPVSTVNVTKKKSLFRRSVQPADDLKERVVDSVNERVGAFVEAEDLSEPPKTKRAAINFKKDKESAILFAEMAAVCLIAMAIFLTNIFMPTSAINTFISSLTSNQTEVVEPSYSELELSPVVGSFSDTEVDISYDGVMSFTAEGTVYPICNGVVQSVVLQNEKYIVTIAHTSAFSSVISGLSTVYFAEGDEVKATLPFAWSDGSGEVKVSLFNGEEQLNCYELSGEIPVWKS